MTEKQMKADATKAEYARIYDNMILPPQDIHVKCSNGHHVRKVWTSLNTFGWGRWQKIK